MITVDVGTTERKPLTPAQRLRLFEEHKGICCLCDRKIFAGERWIDEHGRALGLGGSNDWTNRGVAHVACAAAKTNGPDGDLAKIAKAKRTKRKHLGIQDPHRKRMPGGRDSHIKMTIAHGPVDRRTGEPIGRPRT